jgi:hypothetical protein
MFSKKTVYFQDPKTKTEVAFQPPQPISPEDYLKAKEEFERLGFERNVSKSADGYGDLGKKNTQKFYGINGVSFEKPIPKTNF